MRVKAVGCSKKYPVLRQMVQLHLEVLEGWSVTVAVYWMALQWQEPWQAFGSGVGSGEGVVVASAALIAWWKAMVFRMSFLRVTVSFIYYFLELTVTFKCFCPGQGEGVKVDHDRDLVFA